MTEPNENDPQENLSPQENKGVETQAANPVVTDQDGNVVTGEGSGQNPEGGE